MSPKSFIVHIHGGRTHTVFIALTKMLLAEKGAAVKDEAVFGMKYHAPCSPDVWAVYEETIPLGGGRKRKQDTTLIVEVESSATKESIAKKHLQYKQTLAGANLIILDLDDCPPDALHDWSKAVDWIEERLPI